MPWAADAYRETPYTGFALNRPFPHESLPVETTADAATPAERLRGYMQVIRRRWPVLLVVPLVVAGLALLFSARSTEEYDAGAKILLRDEEPINALLDRFASGGSEDPERDANTKIGLIQLETVADRVRGRLNLRLSAQDLLEKVDTEVEGNSDIVIVTARDPSPLRAAAIANGFADEYVAFRRASARGSLDEAAELARTRLEGLRPEERASEQGRELEARLRELEIAASLQTGGVEVVRRATPPRDPATPRPMLSLLLGLIGGGVLALLFALLLEFADRRFKSEEDMQQVLEAPLLAQVPKSVQRTRLTTQRDAMQDDAYATLAANLVFARRERGVFTLMITSPSAGDGKTTVTLGVARALAESGQKVIAVECDLRYPRFAKYLGFVSRGGVASILSEASTVDNELVPLDTETMAHVPGDTPAALSVLPAGPPAPTPQNLLSRPAMGELLAECRELADFVLVDTPPIGVVHDPMTLATYVDGTILVARLNRTTKDAGRKALRLLRNVDTRILGFVVNGAARPFSYYYYGDPNLSETTRAQSENAQPTEVGSKQLPTRDGA